MHRLLLAISISLTIIGSRIAHADSTTRPQANQPAAAVNQMDPLNPVPIVERVKVALAAMDLSADKKANIQPIIEDAEEHAAVLQQNTQNNSPADRLGKISPFLHDFRQSISAALTPAQMQDLTARLQSIDSPRPRHPATMPSTPPPVKPPVEQFSNRPLEALESSLKRLNLSPDQLSQVRQVLRDAQTQAIEIRKKAMAGEDVTDALQQLRETMRQKLVGILSPAQARQLRDELQAMMPREGIPDKATADKPVQGKTPQDKTKPEKTKLAQKRPIDPSRTSEAARGGANNESRPAGQNDDDADTNAADGPAVGTVAPALTLREPGGQTLHVDAMKGHIIVIEFGSLSSPTFRDQAAALEKLKSQLGTRAFFLLIYTHEAHPASATELDRNTADGISVPEPTTMDQRQSVAQKACLSLKISLPLVVDTMDNTLVKALGGFPNGCIVIGKDGKIAARQRWINTDTLRHQIEEAEAKKQ